jgi:L-threonylcarbamoyladenylate synthase
MTTRLTILSADSDGIQSAARLLRAGQLVAFPTETVYGLGGNATLDRSVASIFEAKGRPSFNPLIIHFPDAETAWQHVETNPKAKLLAKTFWPGPLTLVLPRKQSSNISLLASAGLETLAVRVPKNSNAHDLLSACDCPVAAPSANRSGSISPTTSDHVTQSLGASISAVLDGGPCSIGLESTVIGFNEDQCILLRQGGIAREEIEAVTGALQIADNQSEISSPGMLHRHYAPDTPIRLNVRDLQSGDLVLGFGPVEQGKFPEGSLNLSVNCDLNEAASNLFSMMHQLDNAKPASIAVMPIPDCGLGAAINDRLRRAATSDDTHDQD